MMILDSGLLFWGHPVFGVSCGSTTAENCGLNRISAKE